MALIETDSAGVTASGVVQTLKCGNPECQTALMQVHVLGVGLVRVLDCPGCRRGTEYESTPRGWTVKLLARQQRREPPVPRQVAPQQLNGVKPR